MDLLSLAGIYALLLPLLFTVIGFLLLYGVVRVAVSRGMRDHHKWLDRNRPSAERRDGWPIEGSNHG